MSIKGTILSIILSLMSSLCLAMTGYFEGIVETDTNIPMENVIVILVDEQGNTQSTLTHVDGSYEFLNLSEGWYTVYIVDPAGYLLVTPPCGYHHKYVSDGETTIGDFGVRAQSSGVVIEFGKPGGRPINGIHPISRSQSSFQISIYVKNLQTQLPPYPKSIIVKGYWVVPGSGPMTVLGERGQAAGIYANKNVSISFKNLPGNRMEITLNCPSWPFLSLDGEVATFSLSIPSEGGGMQDVDSQIAFCVESTTLELGDNLVVGDTSPFLGIFHQ